MDHNYECQFCGEQLYKLDPITQPNYSNCGDCGVEACVWCLTGGRCLDCWERYERELDNPNADE